MAIGIEHGLAPFKSYTYSERLLDYDVYFSPTKAWAERLINLYKPSLNKVRVTGYPRLDSLKNLRENRSQLDEIDPKYEFWKNSKYKKKLVVFSWGVDPNVLNSLPDLSEIVYLLHPADEAILKQVNFNQAGVVVSTPEKSAFLLSMADLVLGDFSSMTIEAEVLGAKVALFLCRQLYRFDCDLGEEFFNPASSSFARTPHYENQLSTERIIKNIEELNELLLEKGGGNNLTHEKVDLARCFPETFYPPQGESAVDLCHRTITELVNALNDGKYRLHEGNSKNLLDNVNALKFVMRSYRRVLGRDPDIGGIQTYMKAFRHTADCGPLFACRVLLDLAESKEGRGRWRDGEFLWPDVLFSSRREISASDSPVSSIAKLQEEFLSELRGEFFDYGYSWDRFKALSCDWIIESVPEGVGVDVGGTAYLVKKIQERQDITYFDAFPPRDEEIRKYVAADMAEFGLYFAARSLDFITTRHTLEHSLNPLFQLWQFNRALKDGGRLIVVVPCHTKGWVWFYSHFSCLPYENWLMLFFRAGFRVVVSTAGTWQPHNPDFIEYRFVLEVERRRLRLRNSEYRDFRI